MKSKLKSILVLVLCLFCNLIGYSQTPEKISYQAVVRDADGVLIDTKSIGVRVKILKGPKPYEIVYEEVQREATNENGLLTLEIGTGTIDDGDDSFEDIDWSEEGFFLIQTEMDVTGGTEYSLTTRTELLSVPYALHAKTAESLVGGGTGTGGGANYHVGDLHEGGVVFYVDSSGDHGLIVSMKDINDEGVWSSVSNEEIGDSAQSAWDGDSNSTAIIGKGGDSGAKLCQDYTNEDYDTGTFSDWYLPSVTELEKLWANIYEVQKALDSDEDDDTKVLKNEFYWSSTESNQYTSWGFNFYNGNVYSNIKYSKGVIRAVRSF